MANNTFISIPAAGGGGSSNTFVSPLVNTAGSVSLGIVPLPLGGSGHSNAETIVSVGGTFSPYTAPTNIIRYIGTTTDLNVQSLVSDGTARQVTFINSAGFTGRMIFSHNSGATVANRFILPSGAAIAIGPGSDYSITFTYDTNASRWKITGVNFPAGGSQEGFMNFSGSQVIGGQKNFQGGIIVGSAINSVVYTFSDGSLTGQFGKLDFDYQQNRLGISTGSPQAAVHSVTNQPQTIQAPVSVSATEFSAPSVTSQSLNTAVITTIAQLAGSPAATQDPAGTGYTANGSTYTYNFYTGIPGGSGPLWTTPFTQVIFTDDNSGDPFSVDLSWIDPTAGDYLNILLDINGGGFNIARTLALPTGGSTIDNNDFGQGPVITPNIENVYYAIGTTRTYNAWDFLFDPSNFPTYTNSPEGYSVGPDAADNSAYRVTHTNTSASNSNKVIGAPDGFSGNESFISSSGDTVEGPDIWIADNITTPNIYGYAPDGFSRDYQIYPGRYTADGVYYGATPLSYSVTDTMGFGEYGVQLLWGASPDIADFYKVLRQVNGGGYTTSFITSSLSYSDENASAVALTNDVTVTPTTFYAPAMIGEGPFDSIALGSGSNAPLSVIKTRSARASGGYSKLDFEDSGGSMGYIQADQTGVTIGTPGLGVTIQSATTLPTTGLPGQIVYLTSDGYLYAWNAILSGGVWDRLPEDLVNEMNTWGQAQVFNAGVTFNSSTNFQGATSFGPAGSFTVYNNGAFNNGINVVGTSNFTGHGRVSFDGSVLNISFDLFTPPPGGTVTCSSVKPGVVLTPAGTLATLTIKLPSAAVNGQLYWVASTQIITAVTWQDSGGTAANVIGGKSSIGGTGTGQSFIFIGGSVNKWLSNS